MSVQSFEYKRLVTLQKKVENCLNAAALSSGCKVNFEWTYVRAWCSGKGQSADHPSDVQRSSEQLSSRRDLHPIHENARRRRTYRNRSAWQY